MGEKDIPSKLRDLGHERRARHLEERFNYQVCCFRDQDLPIDREYSGRPDREKDSATISPS